MKPGRSRSAFALASILLATLLGASAGRAAPAAAAAPTAASAARDTPQAKIGEATRALEQAALQADFASDARELELLQQAHDDLNAAADQLHGARRTRTTWLLEDLERAIQRTTAQLGPLSTPGGQGFGPLVPARGQLAQLATEAQELERGAPEVHRLIGTTIIGLTPPGEGGAPLAPPMSPLDLENRELLSWPLGYETAWPQLRARF